MLILDLGIWECIKTAIKFVFFICVLFSLMALSFLL